MSSPSRRQFLTRTMAAFVAMAGGLRLNTSARAQMKSPKEHRVEIRKFKFSPEIVEVRPGDTIVWTNFDIAPHTATAHDKSWHTGKITRGKSAKIIVAENFSPDYFCRFHPNMKASLKIVAAE